jgi:hypothetical protein
MELKPIFPIYIGQSKLSLNENLINNYKEKISFLEKQSPYNSPGDFLTIEQNLLDTNLLFTPLKNEILNKSKEYATKIGINFQDLQICNSWGYQVELNNKVDNFHYHSNSLISGVFYLTKGSPLEFSSNFSESLPFKWNQPNNPETLDKYFDNIQPEEQLLIFFPSNLSHRVTENNQKGRTCIAFNIIPKGEFGKDYAKLYL